MTEERRKEIFMFWYYNLFKKEIYQSNRDHIIKLEYYDDWKSSNRKLICEAFNVSCVYESHKFQLSNSEKFACIEFVNIKLTPLQDFNDNSVTHEDGFGYLYDVFNRDPSANCWLFLKEQECDISKDRAIKIMPYSYHGYPAPIELNVAFAIIHEYKNFISVSNISEFNDDLMNYCGNTKEKIDDMPISHLWNTERTLEFYDALMNFSKEYLKSHKVQ